MIFSTAFSLNVQNVGASECIRSQALSLRSSQVNSQDKSRLVVNSLAKVKAKASNPDKDKDKDKIRVRDMITGMDSLVAVMIRKVKVKVKVATVMAKAAVVSAVSAAGASISSDSVAP